MKTGPSQDDQTLCGVFLIHGSGLQWKQSQTYGIQLGYKAGRLRRQVGEGCYKKKALKHSGCGGFPHLLHKI